MVIRKPLVDEHMALILAKGHNMQLQCRGAVQARVEVCTMFFCICHLHFQDSPSICAD